MDHFIDMGLTATTTWYMVSFSQAALHKTLAHRPRGGVIFHNHVTCHHRHYRGDRLVSRRYIPDEKNLTPWFMVPTVAAAAIAWTLLPPSLFLVHLATLAAGYASNVYLHTQFHLEDSWMLRFEWFRRMRVLHLEHHLDMRCNFAITGFFWDRLMGTYREPDAVAAAWEAVQCQA